jgi:hypothetical protein
MYIEKTRNGCYNIMQVSEPIFNELLLLLKMYANQEQQNLKLPEGITILPKLMKREKEEAGSV